MTQQLMLIEPDINVAKEIIRAFRPSGLSIRYVTDARKTGGALRQFAADLVLVHAEPSSPECAAALEGVFSIQPPPPIALLCKDVAAARFVEGFSRGVVALLPVPFTPAHVERIRLLLAALPARPGRASGQADRRDFSILIDHIQKAKRSGALTVDPGTPHEATALFARGETRAITAATGAPTTMAALLSRPKVAWTFTAAQGAAGEQAQAVLELREDRAEVPIVEGRLVEDEGFDLDPTAAPDEQPLAVAEIAPEPAAPPMPTTPARLLLVDDDPELGRMFSTMFRKRGFQVGTAHDGVDGFEALLTAPADVVVADLSMPRLDGWGFLRRVRQDFRTREVPVAFLSCHDDFRESLKALDAGAQAYFGKSMKLDLLVTQVNSVLEPRRKFERTIAEGPFTGLIGELGPQWVLRALGAAKVSGTLEAKDSWAFYRVRFVSGAPVGAVAQAGQHQALAERAFIAFVASRGAQGTFRHTQSPIPENLTGTLDAQLDRAVATLNRNEAAATEQMLVGGKELAVDSDLYTLYTQIATAPSVEVARLICEEHLTPRGVLERLEMSPLEVEETLRDMIRRGVISVGA